MCVELTKIVFLLSISVLFVTSVFKTIPVPQLHNPATSCSNTMYMLLN